MEGGTSVGLPIGGIGLMAVGPKPGLGRGSLLNGALYRETRPRGPAGRPGSISCSGAFAASFLCLTPFANTGKPEASVMRFSRHHGIYQSDVRSWLRPSPSESRSLPPMTPAQTRERAGRNTLSLIVQMSSGRLFLDRVGRHQSPSPLRRHAQINTHSSNLRAKDDISTLPGTRHFYFALTRGADRL